MHGGSTAKAGKFLETAKVPFKKTGGFSNKNGSFREITQGKELIMVRGSKGLIDLTGSSPRMIIKAERDALDLIQKDTMSTMGYKLDPDQIKTKTNIQI